MAHRIWDIVIDITVPQVVEHIAMYGSPGEVWNYSVQYYGMTPMALKARLELE